MDSLRSLQGEVKNALKMAKHATNRTGGSTSTSSGSGSNSQLLISAEAHLNATATLAVQRVGIALRRLAAGSNISSVGKGNNEVTRLRAFYHSIAPYLYVWKENYSILLH